MNTIILNFPSSAHLSDEQFYQLCQANQDLKFERTTTGELIIMPPTGGETGRYNAAITADFVIWNRKNKLGEVFDSSTCFKLPNGANRSPDVSWIKKERWNTLTLQDKEKFPPLAPDFVLKLMSPTDSLKEAQEKMQEYMDNGVELGWLIDRKNRRVEIYRQGQGVKVLKSPSKLLGEDILLGFTLELEIIWD